MHSVARSTLAVLAVLAALWSGAASADAELRLAGFADVAPTGTGGTLSLPLGPGDSPVTIHVTFGIPSVTIPVQITKSTHVDSDEGLPVTLTDGDRIKVDAVVAGGVIRATKLEIDEFPEIEVQGLVHGLSAAGVALPLAGTATADIVVTLGASGVDVPVRLTAKTKVKHPPFTLENGDKVKVEAGVQNGAIVATEIRR